jgi:hypothetical protein
LSPQLRVDGPSDRPVADDEVLIAELAESSGPNSPGSPETATATEARHWSGLADGDELRARFEAIRVRFVDQPRRAVEDADALVAQVIQALATSFAQERTRLQAQWARNDPIDTEDLRVALQRYGLLFDDLVTR